MLKCKFKSANTLTEWLFFFFYIYRFIHSNSNLHNKQIGGIFIWTSSSTINLLIWIYLRAEFASSEVNSWSLIPACPYSSDLSLKNWFSYIRHRASLCWGEIVKLWSTGTSKPKRPAALSCKMPAITNLRFFAAALIKRTHAARPIYQFCQSQKGQVCIFALHKSPRSVFYLEPVILVAAAKADGC